MATNPWRPLSRFPDAPDGPPEERPIALRLLAPARDVLAILRAGRFNRLREYLDDGGRYQTEWTDEEIPHDQIAFWAPLDSRWSSIREGAREKIVQLLREAEAAAPGWQIHSVVVNHVPDPQDDSRFLVGGTAHTRRVDPSASPLDNRWAHVNPELCRIYAEFEEAYGMRALEATFPVRRDSDGVIVDIEVSPW